MKQILIFSIILIITSLTSVAQTKQASASAALTRGKRTVDLFNGLKMEIDFNTERETLWITGNTSKTPLFITEFIPLKNPEAIGLEIGKSYKLDNLFVSVEYKILEITDNKVTRIWYRIAALQAKLPDEAWI